MNANIHKKYIFHYQSENKWTEPLNSNLYEMRLPKTIHFKLNLFKILCSRCLLIINCYYLSAHLILLTGCMFTSTVPLMLLVDLYFSRCIVAATTVTWRKINIKILIFIGIPITRPSTSEAYSFCFKRSQKLEPRPDLQLNDVTTHQAVKLK